MDFMLTRRLYRTISGILAMGWFKEQFSTGYMTDSPNPHRDLSPQQQSLIVSILSAGTFCGALIAAPFADHIGRRLSLMLGVVVFTIGVVQQLVAMAIPLLVVGRWVNRELLYT
jgi:MFS family permease